jgi:hypothetical protein
VVVIVDDGQPVYDLDLAEGWDSFGRTRGFLVHDFHSVPPMEMGYGSGRAPTRRHEGCFDDATSIGY